MSTNKLLRIRDVNPDTPMTKMAAITIAKMVPKTGIWERNVHTLDVHNEAAFIELANSMMILHQYIVLKSSQPNSLRSIHHMKNSLQTKHIVWETPEADRGIP